MKLIKMKFRKTAVLIFTILLINVSTVNAETTLDQAKRLIKSDYITEVSDSVLNQNNIKDIVKGLNDPYSQYFTKEEYKGFEDSVNNKFSGIGVTIEVVPEGIKIQNVIENAPAMEAGLKAEDIIVKADDHNLAGLAADIATNYIKGPGGTKVNLVIKRAQESLSFSVERREINLPTIESKLINNNATGYIRIVSFGEDTARLFTEKLAEIEKSSPENYIIDLRNNGGGYMNSAYDIAGHFIGRKNVITIQDNAGNTYNQNAARQEIVIDKPIIFLINQYSASASEILSAAVKDYNKAYFVGTTTYGKGVAQSLMPLNDGSYLKLTTLKFLSPMGNVIQKTGISPDLTTTKEIDSFKVSELLMSANPTNNVDKKSILKIQQPGREFYMDLSKASKSDYWKESLYLLNTIKAADVKIGSGNAWKDIDDNTVNQKEKLLFPECKSVASINNAQVNKTFTITFDKSVNVDSVKNKANIELIDSLTGERQDYDLEAVSDKKIKVTPKKSLKPANKYYIKAKKTLAVVSTN